jgi:hypothetical protein
MAQQGPNKLWGRPLAARQVGALSSCATSYLLASDANLHALFLLRKRRIDRPCHATAEPAKRGGRRGPAQSASSPSQVIPTSELWSELILTASSSEGRQYHVEGSVFATYQCRTLELPADQCAPSIRAGASAPFLKIAAGCCV